MFVRTECLESKCTLLQLNCTQMNKDLKIKCSEKSLINYNDCTINAVQFTVYSRGSKYQAMYKS